MGIAQKEVVGYLRQHPCTDCGEKDIIVLDFDHVRGTKRQGISVMIRVGYKWEDILLEIDKCEVVCANCHRKRTAKRGNHFKYLASLVG